MSTKKIYRLTYIYQPINFSLEIYLLIKVDRMPIEIYNQPMFENKVNRDEEWIF